MTHLDFRATVNVMSPSKQIIIVTLACVAFVGVLAGVKMQEQAVSQMQQIPGLPNADGGAPQSQAPVAVDSSFYVPPTGSAAPNAPVKSAPAVIPVDTVSAEAYIVGDLATGEIYEKKNQLAVLPAASMSKLITAITATDMYASATTIEITPDEASVAPDGSRITAGESFTEKDMLYPLLLNSSNIAAEALASSTDRPAFLLLMSSYAWEVGMPGAFFADPSGLSPQNRGSAQGFFALAQYLYKSRPDILAITQIPRVSVATTTGYVPLATTTDFVAPLASAAASHGSHDFVSIHPFIDDPRFLGGKTGHTTAALDTMLTILKINGHPIAIVVLRSLDRTKDTTILANRVEAQI